LDLGTGTGGQKTRMMGLLGRQRSLTSSADGNEMNSSVMTDQSVEIRGKDLQFSVMDMPVMLNCSDEVCSETGYAQSDSDLWTKSAFLSNTDQTKVPCAISMCEFFLLT